MPVAEASGIVLDGRLRARFEHVDGPPPVGKVPQERSGDAARSQSLDRNRPARKYERLVSMPESSHACSAVRIRASASTGWNHAQSPSPAWDRRTA